MRVQIILAGVGGQGVLFASKVFSELGLKLGLSVLGSETHGMSQRGGSVIAHLKLGDFQSPLVREGTAGILYSFEANETYRTLRFLRDGGLCFANFPDLETFDPEIESHLRDRGVTVKTYDADQRAMELGSIVFVNIVLIGYSLGTGLVPFTYEAMRPVLEIVSPPKFLRANLKALKEGFEGGRKSLPDLS